MKSAYEKYCDYPKHLSYFTSMKVKAINHHTVDDWLVMVKRSEYIAEQKATRYKYEKELYYSDYVDDTYSSPIRDKHHTACIVDADKHRLAKLEKDIKYLTREEADKLLFYLKARCDNGELDHCCYVLALVLVRSGIRIGEARALTWDKLKVVGNQVFITIDRSVEKKARSIAELGPPKNNTVRTVYVGLDVYQELKQWLDRRGDPKGLIFSLDGHKVLGESSSQRKLNQAYEANNIRYRSHHVLRHTFATDYLLSGGELHELKKLLGHSKISVTERYAKVVNNAVATGYERCQSTLRPVNSVLNGVYASAH